jgi:hypothetical protein
MVKQRDFESARVLNSLRLCVFAVNIRSARQLDQVLEQILVLIHECIVQGMTIHARN